VGFVGGPVFFHFMTLYQFADMKLIVSSYFIVERGFFFVGIYKKKGLGLLGHNRKKETIELHV